MKTIPFKEDAGCIYAAALKAVEPERCMREAIRVDGNILSIMGKTYDLSHFQNVYAAAFGKSALAMARGLRVRLGKRLTGGVVVCPPGECFDMPGFICLSGAHPLPDKRSLKGARAVLNLARRAGRNDLFFTLISGGGSSLVSLPRPGISLEDKRLVSELLLKEGADIHEVNTVRKHLSRIKGGFLAREAVPAEVINLIISDVVGNDISAVASGPAAGDDSTFLDAQRILENYSMRRMIPRSVCLLLEKGVRGEIPETPKPGASLFKHVRHFIIADNIKALKAGKIKAEELGYDAAVLTALDGGEARITARLYAALLYSLCLPAREPKRPFCLLSGGELTVTVKGKGRGGRNQEFVLAFLIETGKQKPGCDKWLVSSLGTDGIDGPTDAAGAWAGPSTREKAEEMSLDPEKFLNDNDAYTFFDKTGGLYRTGSTGTNVMDIRFLFLE
ncbi:MAG: glycerate kinase [Candidatus Aminicenantes bacterium]|nr:glycerate kinase [Candidatus Aminicenantes bacterium]